MEKLNFSNMTTRYSYLLIFLFFFASISFSQIEQHYNRKTVQTDYVEIEEGIFISKKELSTGEYADYLASIKSDSTEAFYQSQKPDSLSLEYIEYANTTSCGCGPMYISRYEHPAYFDYPAFGLSFEQVTNYCSWLNTNSEVLSLDGQKFQLKYRLPAESEWDKANRNARLILVPKKDRGYVEETFCDRNFRIYDSLGVSTKKKILCSRFNVQDIGIFVIKDSLYRYNKSQPNCYSTKQQPDYVDDIIATELGLFHLNDNMSEMLNIKGTAKGYNYLCNTQKTDSSGLIYYEKPEPWLGVRLICELIKIKNEAQEGL